MSKIVVKIGGSNLKCKKDIQRVCRVIESYNRPLVIVVSAFYGITDYLTGIISAIKNDKGKIHELLNYLSIRKKEVIIENIDNAIVQGRIIEKVNAKLDELEKYLMGINYIGEIPEATEALVLSYGEKLSSLVLSEFLKYNNIDCTEISPEEIKLYTDGEYKDATVDFELSEKIVKEKLNEETIFVVPGFYGISKDNKITLLGRGGTDYSAASIARCIDAPSLDVWKDVNGFQSADPKLTTNPVRLEVLTYNEAAELAYFGARILHPRTVEPLIEKHIPIRIFNIDENNEMLIPLSIINSEETVRDGVVKSVTYNDDISILKLKGPGVGYKSGILARVTTCLDEIGINIKSVITSQIAINLLLSAEDLEKAHESIKRLNLPAVNDIVAINNISIIAVVGQGMLENYGIACRIFSAVANKGINIKMSSLGASQVVTYLIVDNQDRDTAVKEIHDEFFK